MATARRLPDEFRDAAFTRSAAVRAGLTDRRLRAQDLSAPFRGVRMPAGDPSLLALANAYQQRMHESHAFSHSTAAKLLGVPLPLRIGDLPLHVSCPAPLRAAEGRHIRGHRLRSEVWNAGGVFVPDHDNGGTYVLQMTGAALTWILMGTELDVADLVAAGDALVTSRATTIGALTVALDAWGSGQGALKLRTALPDIRVGPLSRPESLLRVLIVRAGLPEPQINVPVHDRAGRLVFRPDLSWPDQRVLVEYEGDLHRLSKAKFRADIHRMEAFADAGWSGIRAVGDDVFEHPGQFLARLQRRLVERGLKPRRLRHVAAFRP